MAMPRSANAARRQVDKMVAVLDVYYLIVDDQLELALVSAREVAVERDPRLLLDLLSSHLILLKFDPSVVGLRHLDENVHGHGCSRHLCSSSRSPLPFVAIKPYDH